MPQNRLIVKRPKTAALFKVQCVRNVGFNYSNHWFDLYYPQNRQQPDT
jgi:hypothetical protein